jgi:hypothetical protein
MKLLLQLSLCSAFLLLASCNKDDSTAQGQTNYLIFGHFYGMCAGEQCVETFMLTENQLLEDQNDDYSGIDFNFTVMSNAKYNQVNDLIDSFPSDLLDEDEGTIGCPDCADQGGLFIQYSANGVSKSWRIDQSKVAVPAYLHEFMDEVNGKIALINS